MLEKQGILTLEEKDAIVKGLTTIREKLEDDPSKPEHIKTVFKVGYILTE